jgi:oxygen-independent coproporphyrinogen III oxidase
MDRHLQLTKLGLFDTNAPRYTSYPTAPIFQPKVGAKNTAVWMAAIPPGSEVSLYVHVPFCRRLCWFCACRTQGTTSDAPLKSYVKTLIAELALWKQHMPQGLTLSRLHWGGGTPTILTPDQITTLSDAIFVLLPMAKNGIFSVEIDPNEIDEARIAALARAGMNRASIGVQDFDPKIQASIGRLQSFDATAQVIASLRQAGIGSINSDILFGLPLQTTQSLSTSVAQLLRLRPDRVALYGYAHVPWMSRRQQLICTEDLPAARERLALFEAGAAMFAAQGYTSIGIDHFALPADSLAKASQSGQLRRNFQGYTDDPAAILLGLGASSIARFPQGYAQNHPRTSDYAQAIALGHLAAGKGHNFQGQDHLRARLIESLMCNFDIDLGQIAKDFNMGTDYLTQFIEDNLGDLKSVLKTNLGHVTVPPDMRAATRLIAQCFDAYRQDSARYSVAI